MSRLEADPDSSGDFLFRVEPEYQPGAFDTCRPVRIGIFAREVRSINPVALFRYRLPL